MPGTTTTIDRNQRKGLYELVRNHLGSIEDFFVALERTKDFARAEQLAVEFAEDFRLLHDIGWAERDERETVRTNHAGPRPDGTAPALARQSGACAGQGGRRGRGDPRRR